MITRKPAAKRKRQCELGTSCPYQHEYQHQQEFGHDAAAKDDGRDVKQRTKVTLAEHTAGALKGTGHRGRKVAVAADKRRAKRAQEMIGDQEHLDGRVQDVREAQRVRWVTHMQQKQGRPTGAIEGSNRGQGKEVRSRATAIGKGQARPSQQSRPLSTTTAIPSPSIRRCDNRPEGSFIAVGEATSVVADTKQAFPGDSRGRSRDEKIQRQGGICVKVSCDADDEEQVRRNCPLNPPQAQSSLPTAQYSRNIRAVHPLPATGIGNSVNMEVVDISEAPSQQRNEVGASGCWICAVCTLCNDNALGLACEVCKSERLC